jgi:flagellar biogenesis protein FliO
MLALQFGRMLLALAFVLGLLWLFARLGRNRQGIRPARGAGGGVDDGRIHMVGRRSLGRHSSIAVVRVAGRTLVVGQTPQQITVLTELHDQTFPRGPGAVERPAGEDTIDMIDVSRTDVLEDHVMPGLALEPGAYTPKAWDAFVDSLREMTVRR